MGNINWTDIINEMPIVLCYVVPGYVFLSMFKWASFKKIDEVKHAIEKSIVISYIMKLSYEMLFLKGNPIDTENLFNALIMTLICAALGFTFGKIISSKKFNDFLLSHNITRTTNDNIWDDVLVPYTLVRVFMEDGISYYGQFRFCETNNREPIFVLGRYQMLAKDGKVLFDYSKDEKEFVVLNTKDFKKIEITYTE